MKREYRVTSPAPLLPPCRGSQDKRMLMPYTLAPLLNIRMIHSIGRQYCRLTERGITMSKMSELDLAIDAVVEIAIGRTTEWISDGEAIDDMVAFMAIEVIDAIFTGKVKVDADDVPFVIGYATSRSLVEAKLLGLGPTKGDPRFGFINLG